MSLKSKFSAFTAAYKSALKNSSSDNWNEAGKDISVKDTLEVIGKSSAYIAKEAVEFSGILTKATVKVLMTPTNSDNDYYDDDNYDGYRNGNEGYGYYMNGIKIHD
ncbi:hypothetical protein HW40_12660 [Mannheimia haemolytica]|uniref:hypothetical protein n=1 Tax=Mannheimia haemolytica TaxID=75985 RepID=UPI0005CA51EF|nr:hypothetical protein [Mannheimia haemolytica]KIX27175.1 hypothetical protein HW40_12660 [Mannheimia haemolytica]MDW0618611.1 hypothetical protein [Mannheimia haemolytica]